jgi:hypothetical protein
VLQADPDGQVYGMDDVYEGDVPAANAASGQGEGSEEDEARSDQSSDSGRVSGCSAHAGYGEGTGMPLNYMLVAYMLPACFVH